MTAIHVSAKHRVIGVPGDARICNLFPDAKIIDFSGQRTALLPHGLHETVILRNMGIDVPAPILSQYDWPGPRSEPPFRVQKLTAALFSTHQRCYCLNGMGTGKTRSALWAYDYLRGLGLAGKMLVVAPLSTLNRVWRREAFRVVPHLSVGILYGDKKRRLKVLEEDHDIYVINPDGMRVILDELDARSEIDVMVLDELALFRNGGADRNKMARRLGKRMVWLWGLTGSPIPTEPTDAWGQCLIVTPHTVPRTFGRFRDEVMIKINQFRYVPKKDAVNKVFSVMQPAVRYTLDDVVELPELVERVENIDMGQKQENVYETLRKHSYALIQNGEITAANAGALLNKMLQVSMGYVYTSKGDIVSLDNDTRLAAVVDACLASDRKVIVFVPFTHALNGVYNKLLDEKIDVAMVHGATPKKARDHIFTLFQDTSKYKVIAAHPGCMSHGLTLTAADTVIWFGPTTSNETFEQANARVRRIGQAHKQLVLMFQSTAVERKVYARLRSNQKLQDSLLELFEQSSDA